MAKINNKNQKSDFDSVIIDIRRVARVVAGGRRFSFRVSVIAGNKKGEVGVGTGKGLDTAIAIEKAFRNAKKNIIKVKLTKHFSISNDTSAKFGSAYVIIKSAHEGTGLVAGSSIRNVLEFAGIKNVNAKIISRSKNKLNNAKAAIKALSNLR